MQSLLARIAGASLVVLGAGACRGKPSSPLITSTVSLVELDTADLTVNENSFCAPSRAGKEDVAMCTVLRHLKGPMSKGILALQSKQATSLFEFLVFTSSSETGSEHVFSARVSVGPFETLAECELALDAARGQELDTGPCRALELPRKP